MIENTPHQWQIKDKVEFVFGCPHGLYAGYGEIVELPNLDNPSPTACFYVYVVRTQFKPTELFFVRPTSYIPHGGSGHLYVPVDSCTLIARFPV